MNLADGFCSDFDSLVLAVVGHLGRCIQKSVRPFVSLGIRDHSPSYLFEKQSFLLETFRPSKFIFVDGTELTTLAQISILIVKKWIIRIFLLIFCDVCAEKSLKIHKYCSTNILEVRATN